MAEADLLQWLAGRVRSRRAEMGWTRADLAARSGLSIRFLAKIEAGDGNVSLLRLAGLARALGTSPEALIRPLEERTGIVALVAFKLVDWTIGLRVTEEDEREGLDTAAHGEAAYRM